MSRPSRSMKIIFDVGKSDMTRSAACDEARSRGQLVTRSNFLEITFLGEHE